MHHFAFEGLVKKRLILYRCIVDHALHDHRGAVIEFIDIGHLHTHGFFGCDIVDLCLCRVVKQDGTVDIRDDDPVVQAVQHGKKVNTVHIQHGGWMVLQGHGLILGFVRSVPGWTDHSTISPGIAKSMKPGF